MNHKDKKQIIKIIKIWLERSGLQKKQVVARIDDTIAYSLSEDDFYNLFLRSNRSSDIPPELTLAVISVFTKKLYKHERCTAAEALEFVKLTRLPIDQIRQVGDFFPEVEFNEALRNHLFDRSNQKIIAIILDFKPKVQINRNQSNHLVPAFKFMPLYHNDVIHTYTDGEVTIFCKDTKLLIHVPEQSTFLVDCQNERDNRVLASLKSLLYRDGNSLVD